MSDNLGPAPGDSNSTSTPDSGDHEPSSGASVPSPTVEDEGKTLVVSAEGVYELGAGTSVASPFAPIGWAQLEMQPLPNTNAGATMNFPVLADTSVVADGNLMVTLTNGPLTVGAGGVIGAAVLGVDVTSGEIGYEYAEMSVSNADGSEKLVLGTASGDVLVTGPSDGNINVPIPFASEVESFGSDLTAADGSIVSTAGGQFFVCITVFLTTTELVLADLA